MKWAGDVIATVILTATLFLVTNQSALAAGTVVVDIKATPHPDAKRPVKDSYTGALPQDGYAMERVDYKNLDEIVVYAVPAPPSDGAAPISPPPEALEIEIRPLDIGQRAALQASSVGATLRLKNTSDQPQTIYCVAEGNPFEFVAVPPNESRETTLRAVGPVEILLESSDEPVARLFVAPTPWVKIAKHGDEAVFEALPAGACKIVSWHPRLPGVERAITVRDKKKTKVEISVGMRDAGLPKIDP